MIRTERDVRCILCYLRLVGISLHPSYVIAEASTTTLSYNPFMTRSSWRIPHQEGRPVA